MHRRFICYLIFLGACLGGMAQNVSVSGALVGNGSYPTLTAAFAALNSGAQTGATITVSVLNDTWEGSGTALLNAGTWTSLTVVPVGQPRTIAGATTAGQPMVDLNGADQVSFAGLIGGQKGLAFYNNSTASTAGTSTIRLRDDAQHNSITHCKVLGASQTDLGFAGGNLVLGTGTQGGNSNNTIDNCDFGPGDTTLPSKCIYNRGATVWAHMNDSNTVANCHFFDCFSGSQNSCALVMWEGGNYWTISGNRFYQQGVRTKTTGSFHRDIMVDGLLGNLAHVASGNICGTRPGPASSPSHFVFTHPGASYTAIDFAYCNSFDNIIVNGNSVSDIKIDVVPSSPSSNTQVFTGIANRGCDGTLINNTVGSTADSNSIFITITHNGSSRVAALQGGQSEVQDFVDNRVGGIRVQNTGGGIVRFDGINLSYSLAYAQIEGNTIGYADAPIVVDGAGGGGNMYGINAYAGALNMVENHVAYMRSSQTGLVSPSAITLRNIGIVARGGALGPGMLVRNTVHSIVLSHPTGTTSLGGMQSDNLVAVTGNLVHSLYLATNNPGALLVGIDMMQGTPDVTNNMVRLGFSPAGVPITTGMRMYGIHNKVDRPRFDHNSVYLGGGGVADTSDTYAIFSMSGHPSIRFLNNIFVNARSNGSGTGTHYVIAHGGLAQYPPLPTSNGNDLLATGVGGKVGWFDGMDQATIFDWRLATGQDYGSISHDPNFINPTGNASTGDLHIGPVSAIEGLGVAGSTISTDFDQQGRSGLSPRDIGADAGNFGPVAVLQPEVDVRGNGLVVAAGDVTPSTLDGTDLDTLPMCPAASAVRTFQLRNLGNANLTLGGLSLSGSSTFTVSPLGVTTLVPGQLVVITVQFSSAVPGTYSATLTLLSNDLDEPAYTFDLRAVTQPDTLAPVAVCQAITIPVGANGIAVVNWAAFGAASTDNCSIVSYVATPAQFTCADVGPQTVQLSLTDAAGNASACSGTLTVADQLAPQAVCNNLSLAFGPGYTAQTTAAALDGGSTDNCGIDSIWAAPLSYTCAQAGPNAVLLSVRDSAGNVGTCTATVTVTESVPPVAVCQPITLPLNASGQAPLNAASLDGGSTDNCGVTAFAASQPLYTCADVGVQPVILTVADGSGNTDTCHTQVTVQDLVPPTLTCADFTVVVSGSVPLTLNPNQAGTVSDACGIASTQLSIAQVGCGNAGTNPLTLTATDIHGNRDSCTVQLTVVIGSLAVVINSPTGPCGYHIDCAGQATGTVSAFVNGACGPYTYFWANGEATATASGLAAGTHSVTVTSADGQQVVRTVTLTEPSPLSLSMTATPSCANGSSGTATAIAGGGQSCQAYTFLWSNGATSANATGLAPGTHSLTVTDAAGCTTTSSVNVGTWPASSIAITQQGGNLSATSGFVAYQWQNASGSISGATGAQFTPTASGTYEVVGTDTYGCTWTSAPFSFPSVGVANPASGAAVLSWHPNPSNGIYHVDVAGVMPAGQVTLTVLDLRGRVLRREIWTALETGTAIDLSDLAAGTYLLELRHKHGFLGHYPLIRN